MSIEEKIQSQVNLARFSTYNIGGNAKYFIEIKDKFALQEAYLWAKEKRIRIYVLGGGSNILINSLGIDGLVVRMVNDEIKVQGDRLLSGAGATLSRLLTIAKTNNLSGLEWSAGIPRATIGGSIRGNAGAFGEATANIVETIEIFDSEKNKFEILSNRDCGFDYRSSILKVNPSLIVWQATLILKQSSEDVVQKRISDFLSLRSQSQPRLPSAGSVFKNISLAKISESNLGLAGCLKKLSNNDQLEQVGAGLIIDKVLNLKGTAFGGAKISLEHANFIVNTGKATSDDVIGLIKRVKADARAVAKINLEEEIEYFGF